MPRERSLDSYANAHYMALCRRVVAERGEVHLDLTRSQAATLRGEIYAWRRVAEAHPDRAREKGVDVTILRDVAFRVTEKGLTALHISKTAGPAAIEAVLGAVTKALSPSEEALERLKNITGGSPPTLSGLPYNLKDEG